MAFEENIGEASIDVRLDTKRLAGDLARARRQIQRSLGRTGMVGGGEGGGGEGGGRPAGGEGGGRGGRGRRVRPSMAPSLDRQTKAGKRLSSVLGRMTKNANKLMMRFRVMAFVTGTLTAAIIALRTELLGLATVAAGIAINIGLEKARDQMDAYSASTAQLRGRMDELRQVATATGQRFTAIADGAGMLAARGMAAGRSFESMKTTIKGVSEASASLGRSGSDTNSTLEEFSEFAKDGQVNVADLRDAISFMPNELRVLSDALNQPIPLIRAWIEEGNKLSSRVLPDVARAMGRTENDTNSLSGSFNRLWNAFTELLEAFNRVGIIDAARSAMNDFRRMLMSSEVNNFMRRLGRYMADLIRQMPEFARSVANNWQSILSVIRSVAGALIGGAAGGLPGTIIGAIIGANDELAASFERVAKQAAKMVADLISSFQKGGGIFTFINEAIARVVGMIGALIVAIRALPALFADAANRSEETAKRIAQLRKEMGSFLELAVKGIQPAKGGEGATQIGEDKPITPGGIDRSLQLYTRRAEQAQRVNQELYNNYRSFVLQSTEATLGAISEISTQLVQDGKVAWQELADSIISQLIRIQTKLLIVKPLMDAMKGGSSSGGGGAQSVLKTFGMSLAGSAGASAGASYMPGAVGGSGLMGGGVVRDPTHAANFTGAANGGVITEPGTIYTQGGGAVNVAEKGREAIVPLDRMKGGDSGGTKVEIINENGSQIEQEQQTGPNGEQIVRAIVREEVASDFARRGNAFRTLERSTNIKRRGRNGG